MFFDRLSSLVSGLGGSKDKAASVYRSLSYFTPMDAVTAYRSDWIARKVVDIPAMDMTRAWRNWQADDEQIEALEAEERRLCLKQRVLKGLKWARLFGGAGLILGTKDVNVASPLNPDTVAKGGLTFVHVASSMQLTAGDTDRDPASPGYGEPSVYRMTRPAGGVIEIHPSRVIRLIGAELPDDWNGVALSAPANTSGLAIGAQPGWGDSVLQALDDAVKNAGIAAGGIASLVMEAKVDVYKIPRLMQSVSNPDYRQRMIDRFSLANEGKSLQNALLMDAEEEYEQKTVNFSGLNEVLTLYLEIAAAAADIPSTRMLAKQSKGLGNGGEADLKNYYDKIGADQEMSLRPGLEKLDELLIRSALGTRPPEIHFAFAPLWQMSETERAAIRKQDADTAKVYADSGLIPKKALAAAVQNTLVEHASYPGLEAALDALGDRPDGDPWTGVSDAEFKTMLAAWQSGAITQETLFLQLQAAGKIEAEASFDAYAEQIANESPPPSAGEEGVTRDPVTGAPLAPPDPNAPPAAKPQLKLVAKDAESLTLYVSRPVTNADEIIAWAKAQGFETTLPAADLHVTVAYSRAPVDWMKAGDDGGKVEIDAGGPRMVQTFGSAVVLLFGSWQLDWRHERLKELGASWDHAEYQPHITITYAAPEGLDVTKVEPYRGRILLGPEKFEELNEDWRAGVTEDGGRRQAGRPFAA